MPSYTDDEAFEIGEPIHLRTVETMFDTQIWWIRGFSHEQGVAGVYVSTKRHGELGDYTIPVGELVKLPAMVRIAVECSD